MTTKTKQHPRNRRGRSSPAKRRATSRGWVVWAALAGIALLAVGSVLLLRGDGGNGTSPIVGGDLHSLVTPDGTTIYAGGHTAVSVSHDGGATWARIPSLDDADAMGWAFLDDAVWLGGHPGMSVSTDGGASFAQQNVGLPATDIHALGGAGELLYAASPVAGFLVSHDAGATWSVRNAQVGQMFMGRILVDPDDPAHAVAPDMQAGAVETRDGGRSWRPLGGVAGAMWVTWDPKHVRHIVVTGDGTAASSTDGGATWSPISVPEGASVVEMDPTNPERLYAAVHEGNAARIWMSQDSGSTWTEL